LTKLDKIGQEKVEEELQTRGFSSENISNLQPLLQIKPLVQSVLNITEWLSGSRLAQRVRRTERSLVNGKSFWSGNTNIELIYVTVYGLSYYTGAIFEVKANDVQIGSISGGSHYVT
jgi:histidyl-tRNA synthetase